MDGYWDFAFSCSNSFIQVTSLFFFFFKYMCQLLGISFREEEKSKHKYHSS